MMQNEYNVIFADSRRSSFIPCRASVKGDIEWRQSLGPGDRQAFNPKSVLLSSPFVVLYSDTQILAFDFQGEKLWGKTIVYGSPVSISDGKVFFRESGTQLKKLSAVHLDGTIVEEKMIVLNSNEDAFPIYLEPLKDGLIAMCSYRIGVEEGAPRTVFYKKAYPSLNYLWVSSFTGDLGLTPLHIRALHRFVVAAGDEIAVFNSAPSDIEEELFRFPYPFSRLIQASASEDGMLYILGYEEGQLVLAAFSLEGEEKWRYSGFTDILRPGYLNPPALGPGKTVHVTIGDKIFTIQEGELLRQYTENSGNISYMTVLEDNFLIFSVGSSLIQLDSAGNTISQITVDESIVTPPVVDKEGYIYVASALTLFKIQ